MSGDAELRLRLQARAGYLQRARNYFANHQVLEVSTPIITSHAVTDPHIDSVACFSGDTPSGWLRPSPEFHLKRLLADGSGDVFEIGKVFRAGETGSRHHPEFTMVEWYRQGFSLQAIIDDTTDFIRAIGSASAYPPDRIVQLRYVDAFQKYAAIDPLTASHIELASAAESFLGDVVTQQLKDSIGDDRNVWLDFLMSHHLEKQFDPEQLTVITHYPADQASLARLSPDDPRFAERFEIYYRGIELANGFKELLDPVEQRQRFEQDQLTRKAMKKPAVNIDETFIRALESGLPDCAGVAVGLERVIMCCEGYTHIDRAITQ